jgi:hypothetical protein
MVPENVNSGRSPDSAGRAENHRASGPHDFAVTFEECSFGQVIYAIWPWFESFSP